MIPTNGCMIPTCLEKALQLEQLKKRLLLRHNEISLKYRNRSIYYQRRCKKLEVYLIGIGASPAQIVKAYDNEETISSDYEEKVG